VEKPLFHQDVHIVIRENLIISVIVYLGKRWCCCCIPPGKKCWLLTIIELSIPGDSVEFKNALPDLALFFLKVKHFMMGWTFSLDEVAYKYV
jgi:hypothetical protein